MVFFSTASLLNSSLISQPSVSLYLPWITAFLLYGFVFIQVIASFLSTPHSGKDIFQKYICNRNILLVKCSSYVKFCSCFSKISVTVSLYWCCATSCLISHYWMKCVFLASYLQEFPAQVGVRVGRSWFFTKLRLSFLQPHKHIDSYKYGLSVWFSVQSYLHCLSESNWLQCLSLPAWLALASITRFPNKRESFYNSKCAPCLRELYFGTAVSSWASLILRSVSVLLLSTSSHTISVQSQLLLATFIHVLGSEQYTCVLICKRKKRFVDLGGCRLHFYPCGS